MENMKVSYRCDNRKCEEYNDWVQKTPDCGSCMEKNRILIYKYKCGSCAEPLTGDVHFVANPNYEDGIEPMCTECGGLDSWLEARL